MQDRDDVEQLAQWISESEALPRAHLRANTTSTHSPTITFFFIPRGYHRGAFLQSMTEIEGRLILVAPNIEYSVSRPSLRAQSSAALHGKSGHQTRLIRFPDS